VLTVVDHQPFLAALLVDHLLDDAADRDARRIDDTEVRARRGRSLEHDPAAREQIGHLEHLTA
jgi:hypothetical protein